MTGTVSFEDLLEIQKGKKAESVTTDKSENSIRYIQIKDLRDNEKIEYTEDGDSIIATNEDLIIAWDGSNAGTIGFNLEGAIGSTLARLRVKEKYKTAVNPHYLGWYLKSMFPVINGNTTGVAIPHINKKFLLTLAIPLFNIKYQNTIVTILNKVQGIGNNRRRSLEKIEELFKSIYLQMFGDPYLNPNDYEEKKLEKLVPPNKIITYGIVQAGPNVEEGVPIIKSGDIKNGKIDLNLDKTSVAIAKKYHRSRCSTGDIVISIRASVGAAAILPKELDGANLTQGTARISPNEEIVNRYFLYATLLSKGIQTKIDQVAKGVTFREITLAKLREVEIPLPPMSLQEEFAMKYIKLLSIYNRIEESAQIMNVLLKSLTQKVFTTEELINERGIFEELLPTLNLEDFLEKKERIAYLIDLLKSPNIKLFESYEYGKKFLFHLLKRLNVIEQSYNISTGSIELRVIHETN